MKKNIIMILSFTVFLTSCSLNWNASSDEKIANLEKQVTELKATASTGMILFEKRNKCASFAPDIQVKIDSFNKEYSNLGKFSIGGIFYSPMKDACLWVRLTQTNSKDGLPMERRSLYEFGNDFGATEPIIGCEQILGETKGMNTCEKWDTELKRLKGEDRVNQ